MLLGTLAACSDDPGGPADAGGCAPAPGSATVVNVQATGATGDDSSDDTAAIQAAVDQVGGTGGTVLVPDGTYMIDAVASIELRSNMTFRMASNAVLKAMPNGDDHYDILALRSVSDVNVIGGTLVGERDAHTGASGEWGMCVGLYATTRVVVEGVTARDCWGDGFYVGAGAAGTSSTDTQLCAVVADNNRRQGLSLVAVDGAIVKGSVFKNTRGTQPQCGIDVEPDASTTVSHVQILDNVVSGNASCGISLYAGSAAIVDVVVDGNRVYDEAAYALIVTGTNGHAITNNAIASVWVGLDFRAGSVGNIVAGNSICARTPVSNGDGNTLSDNTLTTQNCQTHP